jgi:hypothetical protein
MASSQGAIFLNKTTNIFFDNVDTSVSLSSILEKAKSQIHRDRKESTDLSQFQQAPSILVIFGRLLCCQLRETRNCEVSR